MMKKGLIIGLVLVAVFAGIVAIWGVGVSNDEVRTVNRGNAQQESCEAFFDKMWKILQQQAGVTDQYREAFMEVYPALMEGRYAEGGDFMKWVTESNPEFDTKLYDKLMASIEGERNGFFVEQQKLIDIDRVHHDMRETFPKKVIIGKRPNIGYEEDADGTVLKKGITIVKSLKTDKVYETGHEDDVDLFKN